MSKYSTFWICKMLKEVKDQLYNAQLISIYIRKYIPLRRLAFVAQEGNYTTGSPEKKYTFLKFSFCNNLNAWALCWTHGRVEYIILVSGNSRYGQRRCLEAWHINTNHRHVVNRDDGSYLPQEYLYLVGKWRHLSRKYRPRCDFRWRRRSPHNEM